MRLRLVSDNTGIRFFNMRITLFPYSFLLKAKGIGFLLPLFLCTATLSAETLYMEDGSVLRGVVVGQDRETVSLRTRGGLMTVSKSKIRRMVFDRYSPDDPEAEEEARRQSEAERRRIVQELNRELERRRSGLETKKTEEEVRKREEKEFFENEFLQEKERQKREGFRRSLLLPGWGQYYKNQPDRGKIYMGSFLTLLGTALVADYIYRQAATSYTSSNNTYALFLYQRHNPVFAFSHYQKARADRDLANQTARIQQAALLGLGLVYVISAVDARYTDPDLNWLVQNPIPPPQIAFTYRFSFEQGAR